MPTTGVRIPVKLPWKGATNNDDQFVSMKSDVAIFLKFDPATRAELEYTSKVNKKDKGSGPAGDVPGTTTVKRRRRPGYRQRSIKLSFQTGHKAGGGRKSTLVGAKVTIGRNQYASLQFPITSSTAISEVIQYFETGKGKGLKVLKVTDVNSGQGYNLI